MDIKSKNLIPEYLQNKEFYKHVSSVIDDIVAEYHDDISKDVRNLYNITSPDFDPDQTLEHLGFNEFFPFISSMTNKRASAALLANIYDMKGTKKGLEYILRLLGMEARLYEWYYINSEYEKGNPEWPYTVEPCSIVLELATGSSSFGVCPPDSRWAIPRMGQDFYEGVSEEYAFENTEEKFNYLSSYLLWICTKLEEIRWKRRFEDEIIFSQNVESTTEFFLGSTYSPYFYNGDCIFIQSPFNENLPRLGTEHYIGESEFKILSEADYDASMRYDPDIYPTGYIGHSTMGIRTLHIGGSNPVIIGNIDRLDENGWWVEDYIGGERYISEVSEECPHICGAEPSKITYIELDTSIQNYYTFTKGLRISPEIAISPTLIIGNNLPDSDMLTYGDTTLSFECSYRPRTSYMEFSIPAEIQNTYEYDISDTVSYSDSSNTSTEYHSIAGGLYVGNGIISPMYNITETHDNLAYTIESD